MQTKTSLAGQPGKDLDDDDDGDDDEDGDEPVDKVGVDRKYKACPLCVHACLLFVARMVVTNNW